MLILGMNPKLCVNNDNIHPYGDLHEKFLTPISRPTGQLIGQNPKELSKAHSHAHAKGYDSLENRDCKAQIVMPEPKVTRYFQLTVL